MAQRPRPPRTEKLARIYDTEILPVWAERFGRMLLRGLTLPERGQVLDVTCGTGYPATEIVRKMGAGSRLIAIDSSSAMLDVARRKMQEMGAKGVFFRTEAADARLSFAADVYDLVLSNLGLGERSDPPGALADFARVTKPGGEVRATLPLEGSFQEFFDIYREVLTKHDKHELLAKLDDHVAQTYPSAATCEAWLAGAGLRGGRVEVERFTMLFRSSREFFFAPVIEYGPLPEWKDLAGKGQEMQDVFWYIKEAIDAYFDQRAFEVTIVAGALRGTKPGPASKQPTGEFELDLGEEVTGSGEVVTGERAAARAAGDDDSDGGFDEDLDTLTTDPRGTRPPPSGPAAPPSAPGDAATDEPLDAFVDGKPRPTHLDG